MSSRLLRPIGSGAALACVAAVAIMGVLATEVAQAQQSSGFPRPPSLEADEANPRLMQGLIRRTVRVGEVERVYYIHKRPDVSTPAPVLFALHGGEGTAPRRAVQTGYNELGDREGFIAVYPQGLNGGWNDGRSTDFLRDRQDNADDVSFFRAMFDDLIYRGEADPRRLYLSGGSNGGMMSFRLMCEAGDRIAAATVIVASLPQPVVADCRPPAAVPLLMMNGTADPLMPFEGGAVARSADRGAVIPVMQTVEFWRRANGCDEKVQESQVPDRDPADGIHTDVFAWSSCREGAEFVFFRMNGAGHGLPGRSRNKTAEAERLGGKSSNDFDSTEESWRFMKRFIR